MASFHVVLVGAGEINFGSPEGPWNHSQRLEELVGEALVVLCLIDPDINRARDQIKSRQEQSLYAQAWRDTRCFASVAEAAEEIGAGQEVDLIINGCPPHFRGTTLPSKDMDMQLLRSFPQAGGVLVEKPVAAADPMLVDCRRVAMAYEASPAVVSVGYMFRYLRIVDKVKRTLAEKKLVPICINARYIMAYEYARKLAWWNKEQSCGPAVEQATHFVDLVRYLAGSAVLLDTIHTTTVEHSDEAGRLGKLGFDEESLVPPEQRVPRTTIATWKHTRGTASTLCHAIALHGTTYSTEIDVIADGWLFRMSGFYTASPTLSVFSPGDAQPQVMTADDDPFRSEMAALIDSIRANRNHADDKNNSIKSTYADALETYELTWKIRRAGERGYSGS